MATHLIRLAASLALSGALLVGPAFARPASDPTSIGVRFSDLDLASDAGASILRARITRAANTVCGDTDQRDLGAMGQMMACRKTAMASAAPQVELALASARPGRSFAANDVNVARHGF